MSRLTCHEGVVQGTGYFHYPTQGLRQVFSFLVLTGRKGWYKLYNLWKCLVLGSLSHRSSPTSSLAFGIGQLWLSGVLMGFTPSKSFLWNATAKMGTMTGTLQFLFPLWGDLTLLYLNYSLPTTINLFHHSYFW